MNETITESKLNLLTTCFSGCDTTLFLNGVKVESMLVSITRKTMKAIFPVTSGLERLLYSNDEKEFNLVSINELGKLGLITGSCNVEDFNLTVSIDDLSIEATVDFESTLYKILGHWSNSKEEQEEIRSLYIKLEGEKND